MIKGLVLAGNFREYVIWLQENIYNRSEYPFLDAEDESYNRVVTAPVETKLYLVGSYRSRHNMLTLARARFKNVQVDTVPLGFNANPDKWREPEPEEEIYESD